MALFVSETFINATRGYRFGDSGPQPYETGCDTPGELYRAMQREYGRCAGKVYVDKPDGGAQHVGWIFVSRQRYEDARPGDPDPTYLREVWVTVHSAPDTVERTVHYQDLAA